MFRSSIVKKKFKCFYKIILDFISLFIDNKRTKDIKYHFLSDFHPEKSLIADDIVDSGETLKSLELYKQTQISGECRLRTAVLYRKSCTVFEPDFYFEDVAEEKWVVCPWEDT